MIARVCSVRILIPNCVLVLIRGNDGVNRDDIVNIVIPYTCLRNRMSFE